jgi:hypothetical protein
MEHRPSWACARYHEHVGRVCAACLRNYESLGQRLGPSDFGSPLAIFKRGWMFADGTHWFEADDETLFRTGDGRRLVAEAACGAFAEMAVADPPHVDAAIGWAPHMEEMCPECGEVLADRADRAGENGE